MDLADRHGDLDVVIVAFGVLGSQDEFERRSAERRRKRYT